MAQSDTDQGGGKIMLRHLVSGSWADLRVVGDYRVRTARFERPPKEKAF
jgi:hypothetical protein